MLDKVNDDDDDDDNDDDDDDDVDNDYLDWVFSRLYYHDPISPVNVFGSLHASCISGVAVILFLRVIVIITRDYGSNTAN